MVQKLRGDIFDQRSTFPPLFRAITPAISSEPWNKGRHRLGTLALQTIALSEASGWQKKHATVQVGRAKCILPQFTIKLAHSASSRQCRNDFTTSTILRQRWHPRDLSVTNCSNSRSTVTVGRPIARKGAGQISVRSEFLVNDTLASPSPAAQDVGMYPCQCYGIVDSTIPAAL